MGRALLTISFMAVLLWWLQKEFHKNVSLRKYWQWFAAAILVQAIANVVFFLVPNRIVGNFFYHAIGGGATTALLFVYLIKTYSQRYSWRVELALLFGFVSALGVMNELAEYAGEFAIRVGLFSWDSHDTWRDLAANTLGAIIAWSMYRLYVVLTKSLS